MFIKAFFSRRIEAGVTYYDLNDCVRDACTVLRVEPKAVTDWLLAHRDVCYKVMPLLYWVG
jgi:hypothetical protein